MTEGVLDKKLMKQSFRNLLIMSIIFQVVFAASLSLLNLQSSLNEKDGIGTVSLSVVYACFIVSGAFAPVVVSAIGAKWTLVAAWVSHFIYTSANFYPRWLTILPASILLGGLSGPLWTAQGLYLSHQAFVYSDASKESPTNVLSRFNGIFFTLYGTTQISGNLISSLVLKRDIYENANETSRNTSICGALYCPAENNVTSVAEPDNGVVYTLFGIFATLNLIGLLLTILLLPALKMKPPPGGSGILKSAISCGKLLGDTRMSFLVPLLLFSGMRQAILSSDFTKSYISCVLGVGMVGYIMAVFGGSTTAFAFISSRLAEYTGRYVILVTACGVNMAALMTMLFWNPSKETTSIHFVIVILLGATEGIWQTQSNALVAFVFKKERQPAFANYYTWRSIGFTITFAYSNILCVSSKLYVAIGLLALGTIFYTIVEIKLKPESKSETSYESTASSEKETYL